ncbi:UNVERIFIED_CONTAM: hypothetical protein Scaly_0059400 [Sesamum calycinum]|uniref:Reverse transcriptase domain-containing protein n=1 Tax=Sesamum calycinum TaxID=2727403 RepID=A0AAW2SU47_9LAMI
MSEVCDYVEWSFLKGMLERLCFDNRFVRLIFTCISTVPFSFILNGKAKTHPISERRIRQGDPLSPYLFIFCVEATSRMLLSKEHKGLLIGTKIARRAHHVSHLLFFDDTIIYCEATLEYHRYVMDTLWHDELKSGQLVSMDKSTEMSSLNTPIENWEQLTDILRIQVEHAFSCYLGLLAIIGQSKQKVFEQIQKRMWRKPSY